MIMLGGCGPTDEDIPTLMASPLPPTLAPVVLTPTPTPSTLPSPSPILATYIPVRPTLVFSSPEPVSPPLIVTTNGTLIITLTDAQLNDALSKRFSTDPITSYAGPPHATLGAGTVELTITLVSNTPTTSLQTATLTLTLATLPTVSGTVLDVRAVRLIKPDQISTLQVKPAQALLTATLEALATQASGLPAALPLNWGDVTVSSGKLTLTVLLS